MIKSIQVRGRKQTHCATTLFRLTAVLLFVALGCTAAWPGAAMGSALAQSTAPTSFAFSGQTRARGGDTTVNLGLVEVELYCSTNADDLGEKIASTQSDSDGVYSLAAPRTCEFYNLVAVPPQGHVAYQVLTVGGKAINDRWIQYSQPLQGKELGRNEFWMIADFAVAITPTPFPAQTLHPSPTSTQTAIASPSATSGSQATANFSLPILEYLLGVVAVSGVVLAVRRALQRRRRKG
jgi:hypothetical protein